jgi:hypothetical protein
LRASGWIEFQSFLRDEVAEEEEAVEELSDPCRLWVARKGK